MRSHTRYFHPRIRAGRAPFILRDLFQSCVQCSNKTCCNPDEWRVRVEGLDFFDSSCNMNSWQRAYHAGLTIPHFRGVFPSTLQFFGGGANKSIGVACRKSLSNPPLVMLQHLGEPIWQLVVRWARHSAALRKADETWQTMIILRENQAALAQGISHRLLNNVNAYFACSSGRVPHHGFNDHCFVFMATADK